MAKIRVGVLRGGPSDEYEVSLKSGDTVLQNLSKDLYSVYDILIDKQGIWHFHGVPKNPVDIFPHIDVIFNSLHGAYGEDGQVQQILDKFAIPYTGSGSVASAIAMNKVNTKRRLCDLNIKMPKHSVLVVSDSIREDMVNALKEFTLPVVVKPVSSGSSVGVVIAKDEDEFVEGVRKAFEHGKEVLVEEYIDGKEATCGVIEEFRGSTYYTLPPIEILPKSHNSFFDYNSKYVDGEASFLCPGNFTANESRELQRLAKEVHQALNLDQYSRSDFIVTPRDIYFLEVNTLPGSTKGSLVPLSIKAVGSTLPLYFDHLIKLALKK